MAGRSGGREVGRSLACPLQSWVAVVLVAARACIDLDDVDYMVGMMLPRHTLAMPSSLANERRGYRTRVAVRTASKNPNAGLLGYV